MVSQRPHSEETVLVRAARRLLEGGETRLTLAALARETGLSRSTIYRWFPNPKDLREHLRTGGVEVEQGTLRARITTATIRAFEELGLHGTTVEEVARRAGVAAVTIYRQFGSRDGLLDAALKESSPRRAARALALCRDSVDLETDLAAFAATALSFISSHAGVFRIALGATPAEQRRLRALRQAPRGTTAALKRWFGDQMAAGRMQKQDPQLLAMAFTGMLLSLAYVAPLFENMPLQDPVGAGRALARLFVHGTRAQAQLTPQPGVVAFSTSADSPCPEKRGAPPRLARKPGQLQSQKRPRRSSSVATKKSTGRSCWGVIVARWSPSRVTKTERQRHPTWMSLGRIDMARHPRERRPFPVFGP
ncbi:MAG: TetR/AcrR family transcriptional regulator, partial [Pseudomonadota bacterium]